MRLARQSREDSWFQHYDLQHPTYIGLEASAASIADYKSDVINGLLQTERYARAILEATLPDPTEDRIEQHRCGAVAFREVGRESKRFGESAVL